MQKQIEHMSDQELLTVALDLMQRIDHGRADLEAGSVPEWLVTEDSAKVADWAEELAYVRAVQAKRSRRDPIG